MADVDEKKHDLWLYRLTEEGDISFYLTEESRQIFGEIPELKEVMLDLTTDTMFLAPNRVVIMRKDNVAYNIDMDLFSRIIEKTNTPHTQLTMTINYANMDVPFYEGEKYLFLTN